MERPETHDRGTSPGQPGTIKPSQGGGGGVADAMMSNPEPGLPLLPGTSCADPTKTDFHRSQTLNYSHGYAMARRPTVGIGGDRLQVNQGPRLTWMSWPTRHHF
ncbi:unnamed protein product [Pipistrellus nathusii]|uniref:Uncharacterized protein n=1 Tax=Pipistrellus nathusii TaxID=59473 RepID=A0ABN9Z5X6_PIPNA